jgi:hypothetical protein
LGHYRLEIFKELTSGANIQKAMATSMIQRIFENYKGQMYFLLSLNLRVQNKLVGKIGVRGKITEVPRVL